MPTPIMLYYGGRMDSVEPSTGTLSELTTAGTFDSSYADCSLRIQGAPGFFKCPFTDDSDAAYSVTTGHILFFHAEWYTNDNANNSGQPLLVLYDSSNNPWLRIFSVYNGGWGVFYNSGTGGSPTWTQLGSAWGVAVNKNVMDLIVTINTAGSHTVQFIQNGSTLVNTTFTQASMANLAYIMLGQTYHGANLTSWSQMMAAQDLSLVGAKCKTIRPNGAGTYSQWTGSYTNVNEVVTDDGGYENATSIDLLQSHAMGDITVPTGMVIQGIRHCFRVKNDGAVSPLNVQSLLRSGSTDSLSANLSGITAAYGNASKKYPVDPTTTLNWTLTTINGVELGYKSKT